MICILNLKINDLDLLVDVVIKKRNKRIYFRPKTPNIVKITTPIKLTESKIKDYLTKYYDFIKRSFEITPSNTNVLHFLGQSYNLNIIIDKKPRVMVMEDTIYIYAQNQDEITIKRAVDLFYTLELAKIVENNIASIKKEMNLNFEIDFEYKKVKTYFGECFPKKRRVILATKLAKYDIKYILSVIYHELAHFYYMNHSLEFYNYLESVFPNYRKTQKELKKIKFGDIY